MSNIALREDYYQVLWTQFFDKHRELQDIEANRQRLFDYALSLSDDGIVKLQHLEEAATTISGLARQYVKQQPTAGNLAQDTATLEKFCRITGLQPNAAVLNLLREKVGSGFDHSDIDAALRSGLIQLGRASDEQLAERAQEDAEARADYLRNHASPEELRAAARTDFEERRQAAQRADVESQIETRRQLDQVHGFPKLPEVNQETGERIDANFLNRLSTTDLGRFKAYMRKYGAFQLTQRLNGRG